MSPFVGMSRGPVLVRDVVAGYLEGALPGVIAQARASWNLSDEELPDPFIFHPYEQDDLAHDHIPATVVNVQRDDARGRVDLDANGTPTYTFTYNVRLFTWIGGVGREQTLQTRDDYSTALRWCLLRSYQLGVTDGSLHWVGSSLTTEYLDAVKVKGDRWLSQVIHSLQVVVEEHDARSPLGTVGTASLEVVRLPIHPAMQ